MAKTASKRVSEWFGSLRRSWMDRRIEAAEASLEFDRQYLPILEETSRARYAERTHNVTLRLGDRLSRAAIGAGIPDEGVEALKAEALASVDARWEWKRRALVQNHKRRLRRAGSDSPRIAEAEAAHAQALVRWESGKEAARKKAMLAFAPKTDPEKSRVRWEGLRSTVLPSETAAARLREEQNLAALERRLGTLRSRIEAKTTRLGALKERLGAMSAKDDSADQNIPAGEILRLDHLSMHFGGLKAVDDLSFSVRKGEIFGLIGPNGAGKTTVFNCLTRFYKPTEGNVYYRHRLGEPMNLNRYKVHQVIRLGIARTFQNIELIWELNVLDNMMVGGHTLFRTGFFGHLFGIRKLRREEAVIRGKAERILTELGLAPYMYMPVLGLPYGILKKVELARTLMTDPQLIILDEPAAGLNDIEKAQLRETIRQIQQRYDATIFLVEHDMGLVMNLCDTICAISFGKMLAIGTPKEIQQSPIVRQAYLGGE